MLSFFFLKLFCRNIHYHYSLQMKARSNWPRTHQMAQWGTFPVHQNHRMQQSYLCQRAALHCVECRHGRTQIPCLSYAENRTKSSLQQGTASYLSGHMHATDDAVGHETSKTWTHTFVLSTACMLADVVTVLYMYKSCACDKKAFFFEV